VYENHGEDLIEINRKRAEIINDLIRSPLDGEHLSIL
jgi:hypothetical protein